MGITGEKWVKVRSIIVDTETEYILGRISGIIRILSNTRGHSEYNFNVYRPEPKKRIFWVKCNLWQYAKIKKELDYLYPGMCEFESI